MSDYLVFFRDVEEPWLFMESCDSLGEGVRQANDLIKTNDYAVVMEVSGTDAVPMFTFKYGAKRGEGKG